MCDPTAAAMVDGSCGDAMAWSPPEKTYLDVALSGSIYQTETSTGVASVALSVAQLESTEGGDV